MTFRIADLEGKVFLVTGASTGIGAAVAKTLAAEGVRVAVHYNESEGAAHEVADAIGAKGCEAFLVQGDLADPSAAQQIVTRAAEHFGHLDGLINNGGSMLGRIPVMEASDDHVRKVFELNALSLVAASRAAVPWLRRQGGTIINTTSIAARNGGGNGAVLYAAAKAFVSSFTRGFAKEVVADRIRVNAVAPGTILTPFHERFSNEEQMKAMVATIPMGRAGTAEDCVGAYLYLASETLSGYVTGQVIEVNGGQLMP
ncbi:MAG TPA: SDR family NAD(P)-dependent oxidoreductase [Dongiaceae bacterium]|nr:SDR family NAD(P)-dependent oxidoreductase [Dongiaceae bacterium]